MKTSLTLPSFSLLRSMITAVVKIVWLRVSDFIFEDSGMATVCIEGGRRDMYIVDRMYDDDPCLTAIVFVDHEQYIFRWDAASVDDALKQSVSFAADPTLSFNWRDSAELNELIRDVERI